MNICFVMQKQFISCEKKFLCYIIFKAITKECASKSHKKKNCRKYANIYSVFSVYTDNFYKEECNKYLLGLTFLYFHVYCMTKYPTLPAIFGVGGPTLKWDVQRAHTYMMDRCPHTFDHSLNVDRTTWSHLTWSHLVTFIQLLHDLLSMRH